MSGARVMIVGGAGLLGQHTAQALQAAGHEPVLVVRGPIDRPLLAGLAECETLQLDLTNADDQSAVARLRGADALVYALGPDDREIHPAPAAAFFNEHLVQATARVAGLARQAGIGRMVVLGSYFTAWHRMHPEIDFAGRHPYVGARQAQAERAIAVGGGRDQGGMDVCVLEIPYVFGAVPQREPMWKQWLFDRLLGMPVVMYPDGGSSVVTAAQVGACAGAAAIVGRHQARYPLADLQLDWASLLKLILPALGRAPRVITVPRLFAEPAALQLGRQIARAGNEAGIDPRRLMRDIMYAEIFVDPAAARHELGLSGGGVPEAIVETVRASYPAGVPGRRKP